MNTIPSQTNGEPRLVRPVHDHFGETWTVAFAPSLRQRSAASVQSWLIASCNHGLRRRSKLVRIREAMQHGIVARRFEKGKDAAEDAVQQRRSVHDVEVERPEQAIKMELRFVIERATDITR